MNAPRYFHISDILSVALGNTVTFKDEMTLPDGTQRPAYNTNMDGVIDLIAHITGNELRNPRNPAQYDLDLMMHLLPHARRALDTQCPWLRGITFPERDLPRNDHKAANDFCRAWVNTIAAAQGSAWFTITEDPDIGRVHKVTIGGPRFN